MLTDACTAFHVRVGTSYVCTEAGYGPMTSSSARSTCSHVTACHGIHTNYCQVVSACKARCRHLQLCLHAVLLARSWWKAAHPFRRRCLFGRSNLAQPRSLCQLGAVLSKICLEAGTEVAVQHHLHAETTESCFLLTLCNALPCAFSSEGRTLAAGDAMCTRVFFQRLLCRKDPAPTSPASSRQKTRWWGCILRASAPFLCSG